MKHYRPKVDLEEVATALVAPVVACPACNASLAFHRSSAPRIDACGFESYSFACTQCGTPLAGIIDPFDDTLLLSQIAA